MSRPKPTNRAEAVAEIIETGCTIPAMLAVAEAFPLPGEREVTARMLEQLAENDPEWAKHLIAERDKYVESWRP